MSPRSLTLAAQIRSAATVGQMDNLTHSLVGLFLARAGLNRLAPDATAAMILAANLPDADIVAGVGGAPAYLEWHRVACWLLQRP